ncbi:MAG: hypothetical protein KHW92_01110 [Ruminococcus sp.]|jgi:hypothetical protein|nr:hypothetical protein [Ruminococcus sp.]
MKYKNIEVVSIVNFLNSISEKKLPQKISYAIMRNTSNFQKECNYYEQALKKILESYKDFFVKKSDDELVMTSIGVPLVDNKHMKEYTEEIQELLDIEVEIQIYKIDSKDFDYEDPNGKYDVLTVKELLQLTNLFCKEDKQNNDSEGISEKDTD